MKKILLLGLFCLTEVMYSQTEKSFCEKKAAELNTEFEKHLKEQEKEKASLYDLEKQRVSEESSVENIKNKEKNIKKLDSILKSLVASYKSLKGLCKEGEVSRMTPLFKYEDHEFYENKEEETITYSYFGDDLLLKEDGIVDEKTAQGKVFKKVLEKESKSYFGDITIPKNDQVLSFTNSKLKNIEGKYKFKKIDIEIHDGSFRDIRVFVEYKGEIHIYSNFIGINFLRFSERAKYNKLFYMQTIKSGGEVYDNEAMENMFVRLGDVMVYNYKVGNNYIPHDLSISLPLKNDKGELTNAKNSVNYKIKQSTHLDKILELRAFTDFLALFGESNNGLVQLEGKAKFYLFPNPRQLGGKIQGSLMKSVHPYINYSRFEKGNNFVSLNSALELDNPLALIERSFITAGGELDVYEIQHKDYPVNFTFQANYNFQLTRLQMPNDEIENVRGIFYGAALDVTTKRFNNFGFNYKVGFSWYDFENYNESIVKDTGVILPNTIPVLSNQAEAYYHPSEDPNQAIFLRLKIFNYSGTENDNAFYQLQFGYKFSIGSRRVK